MLTFTTVEMSDDLIKSIDSEAVRLFNAPRSVHMLRNEFINKLPETFYGKVEFLLWNTHVKHPTIKYLILLTEIDSDDEIKTEQQKLKPKTTKRITKSVGKNYCTCSKHILKYNAKYIKLMGRELLEDNTYNNFENCLRTILRLPIT